MTTPTGKSHTGPVGPRFRFPRSKVPDMSLTVGRLAACDGAAASDRAVIVSTSNVTILRMCPPICAPLEPSELPIPNQSPHVQGHGDVDRRREDREVRRLMMTSAQYHERVDIHLWPIRRADDFNGDRMAPDRLPACPVHGLAERRR